jgi:hypothetical protein
MAAFLPSVIETIRLSTLQLKKRKLLPQDFEIASAVLSDPLMAKKQRMAQDKGQCIDMENDSIC